MQWLTSSVAALQSSGGRRSRPVRLRRRGCSRGLDRRDCRRPSCWLRGWSFRRRCRRRQGRDRRRQERGEGRPHDCCCHPVRVRRHLHEYGWAEPGAWLEYGCDQGQRCDFSFVVAVPGEGRLVDPVVDPHEVSIFSKLGDDLSSAYSLSLACDRSDRHEALLGGSVYSALDRLESFHKVADGEVVSETSAPFVALPVMLTSSVPVARRSRLQVHQQTTRLQRCLRGTCPELSLRFLVCHRQP
jgi:hypothetical protein